MSLQKFTFAALAELDQGRIAKAVECALQRAVVDCNDRPGEEKARTVTLVIELEPVMEGKSHDVAVTFRIGEKSPPRKSAAYVMRPTNSSDLLFNDMSADDPGQNTISFAAAATAAVGAKK